MLQNWALADEALETQPRRSGGNWETEWVHVEEGGEEGYRETSSLPELVTGHVVSWSSLTRVGRAGILLPDHSLLTYV